MNRSKEIELFFDQESKVRDRKFSEDPILGYEQIVRQEGVLELLDIGQSEMVLDIGCGNARDVVQFLGRGAKVVGLDLSMGMLQEGMDRLNSTGKRKEAHLLRATATSLPFPDGTFDKVSCSEVLEPVPDWRRALGEIVRVLKTRREALK